MNASVAEICENTKMGREFALLGNYETSLVYYQGVVQQIHRLLQSVNDPMRRERWQEVGLTVTLLLIFSPLFTNQITFHSPPDSTENHSGIRVRKRHPKHFSRVSNNRASPICLLSIWVNETEPVVAFHLPSMKSQ